MRGLLSILSMFFQVVQEQIVQKVDKDLKRLTLN